MLCITGPRIVALHGENIFVHFIEFAFHRKRQFKENIHEDAAIKRD